MRIDGRVLAVLGFAGSHLKLVFYADEGVILMGEQIIDAAGFPPERAPGLWGDLRDKYANVSFETAVGTLRTRQTLKGRTTEATSQFAIAPGNYWYVADEAGEIHIQQNTRCWIRGVQGHLEAKPEATVYSAASRWRDKHPHRLLGSPGDLLFDDPHDFHHPAGPPSATTVAGRSAWEFVLEPPPHKSSPLHVTLDAETGTCLRTFVHVNGDERLSELTYIEFDTALDPKTFEPSDPVVDADSTDQDKTGPHREQLAPVDPDSIDATLVPEKDRTKIRQLHMVQQRAEEHLQQLINDPTTSPDQLATSREYHRQFREEKAQLLQQIAATLNVNAADLVVGNKTVNYEPSLQPDVSRLLWKLP